MTTYQPDKLFAHKHPVQDFKFNEAVAAVFPDMIRRSAPGYATIVEHIGLLAPHFAQPNTVLYDLGSSLGAVAMVLRKSTQVEGARVIAIDQSAAMVKQSKAFFNAQCMMHEQLLPVTIKEGDILEEEYEPTSLIALNFTLQFIEPNRRLELLTRLRQSLVDGGALFLSEKIRFEDAKLHHQLNDLHIAFKRSQGYSELEIAQKRQAIENIMKIDTFPIHEARLRAAGFSEVILWFTCLNFCSILALP